MLDLLRLVRHGEVHNPDLVVYADLAGFGLSEVGRRQATAAAARLETHPVDTVVSSPLARALETAEPIAAAAGVDLDVDDRLTEWRLAGRWVGVPWGDLPARFPGEVEAYLAHPEQLAFSPESIAEVADRMQEAVAELGARFSGGTAVLVSHQDPLQALRLRLTNRPLSSLQQDKPLHGGVYGFAADGEAWIEQPPWVPETLSQPFPPVEVDHRPTIPTRDSGRA